MPTKQERIQKLKERAAEYRRTADEKEEEARKLEVEHRKVRADRNRKHETKVKITLGAVLLLLPNRLYVPVLRAIPSVLAPRSLEFLNSWCKSYEHEIDKSTFGSRLAVAFAEAQSPDDHAGNGAIDDSPPEKVTDDSSSRPLSAEQKTVTVVADPVGDALKAIVSCMSEGAFSIVAPEILDHASPDQRAVLEPWIAARTGVGTKTDELSTDGLHDQPVDDPSIQDSDDQSIRENAEIDRSRDVDEEKKLDSGTTVTGGDENL